MLTSMRSRRLPALHTSVSSRPNVSIAVLHHRLGATPRSDIVGTGRCRYRRRRRSRRQPIARPRARGRSPRHWRPRRRKPARANGRCRVRRQSRSRYVHHRFPFDSPVMRRAQDHYGAAGARVHPTPGRDWHGAAQRARIRRGSSAKGRPPIDLASTWICAAFSNKTA